jgi:hypothetical protein
MAVAMMPVLKVLPCPVLFDTERKAIEEIDGIFVG